MSAFIRRKKPLRRSLSFFSPIIELLEDRLAPSITQLTLDAFDHRWPSNNNNGDYVYSAQVAGFWQIFRNGVQLTTDSHNNRYASISDVGDIVYFKDGGSGGNGWQVVRRSAAGSESTIEFSSVNNANGAHRDANQYSGIASNGTTISGYNFFDSSFDSLPTRRFNVSGLGQLAFDFGSAYNHPDINILGNIVFASSFSSTIYKTSTSGSFPGTSVASGTMARINDSGDIVTVSGNLSSPSTVTIRSAPGYTQSTVVSAGSWADINNNKEVVFENLDAQNRRQIYRYTPGPDLVATNLAWNAAQSGVEFSYEVKDTALSQNTTAALYWASGTTFGSVIGAPVYDTQIDHAVGHYGPYYVPMSVLGLRPASATHLLLFVDPPDAQHPQGLIAEANEVNNMSSVRSYDVVLDSATRVTGGGFDNFQAFDLQYSIAGDTPPQFRIGLYVSSDDRFDGGTDRLLAANAFSVIPVQDRMPNPDGTAKTYSRRIDLGVPREVTGQEFGALAKDFYILVVADDEASLVETDRGNNIKAATLRSQDPYEPEVTPLTHARIAPGFATEYSGAQVTPANVVNFLPSRSSIDTIIVHAMAGTLGGSVNRFQEGTFVSAHYMVGQTGSVVQMVSEGATAFHAGTVNGNSIGIEHEDGGNPASPGQLNPNVWASDNLLRSSAHLAFDVASRYSIPIDRTHIRGHEEVSGPGGHTDPGPQWPWVEYMQLVSGAPGARVSNVLLPGTEIQPQWDLKPGKGLYYAPLGVNFQAVEPTGGGLWKAESNTGTLQIFLKDFLGIEQFLVGQSSGSASLTLFSPGTVNPPPSSSVSLTGDIDPTHYLLKWQTSGFSVELFGVTLFSTGPKTFWVEPEEIGIAPSESVLFPDIVRAAEHYIHAKLAGEITRLIGRLGSIADPGETTLLVTNSDGRRTGVTPSGGVITEIPGSAYFTNGPAVVFIMPGNGAYTTAVTGRTTGEFVLVVSTADYSGELSNAAVLTRSTSGFLAAGQTVTYGMILEQGVVDINAPPSLNTISGWNVDEGNLLSFTATATDPDLGQTRTYSLVGPPAGMSIDPGTGMFTWVPADGANMYTVTMRVTDNGRPALSDTRIFTITVSNVAPMAAFTNSGPVVLGSTVTVSFSNTIDLSSVDTAAGFHYAFALDPSALVISTYANSGANSSAAFSLAAGTHSVYGRIIDKDNGYTEYQTTVTVNKATPAFSQLSSPTIIVATAATTLSGKISLGSLIPTGNVTIQVNGISKSAAISADGTFSAQFATETLGVGAYPISYSYGGDVNFNAAAGAGTLSVTYNVALVVGPMQPKQAGSAIPFQIQLANANGSGVSSPNLAVTALGIASVGSPNVLLPVESPGNANPGNRFTVAGGGRYQYHLKTSKTLAAGTYLFYFTIEGDPLVHSLEFEVK